MVTKVPSELSKRLLKAQSMWDAELQHLRACVQQINTERAGDKARDQRSRSNFGESDDNNNNNSDLDELLSAMQSKLEAVDELTSDLGDLRDEVQLLHGSQDTTVRVVITVSRFEYAGAKAPGGFIHS